MTLTQFTCICIGQIVLGMTFVLGILVGVSMSERKRNGYGNEGAKGSQWWHQIERRRTEECVARCRSGCAKSKPEARVDKRPPG